MQWKARVVHQGRNTSVRLFDRWRYLFLLYDDPDHVVETCFEDLAVLSPWEVPFFELVAKGADSFELRVEVVLALFFYEIYTKVCQIVELFVWKLFVVYMLEEVTNGLWICL